MALDMEEGDWIPLFRKIRKSWLWQDAEALRAWIDLIMLANHHDGGFRFRSALHPIKRGQLPTTHLSLAKRNGWSRDKVRTFLRLLEAAKSVTIEFRTFDTTKNEWVSAKTDSGFILLTIVNYPLRKAGQYLPTAEDAAESMGFRQGISEPDRQERHRDATGTPQGPDTSNKGNKGNKGKKGGEEAPAVTPPPPVEPPPTPPNEPLAETPDSAGNQTPGAEPPDQAIIAAVHGWDPTFPVVEIRKQINRAIHFGVSKAKLLNDVKTSGKSLRIWTIVDEYQYRPKPEKTRENAPTEVATIVKQRRNGDLAKVDQAQEEITAKIAQLPPEEVAALRREVEEDATAKKIFSPARPSWIESRLRTRVAEKYGIKGC